MASHRSGAELWAIVRANLEKITGRKKKKKKMNLMENLLIELKRQAEDPNHDYSDIRLYHEDDIIGADDQHKLAMVVYRLSFAEFLGTFFYCLFSSGAILSSGLVAYQLKNATLNAARLIALAMTDGMALASILFTILPFGIAGRGLMRSIFIVGHLNPAVTAAAYLLKEVSGFHATSFVLAQMSGAVCASFVCAYVMPESVGSSLGTPAVGVGMSTLNAFVGEAVMTLMLVLVVIMMCCRRIKGLDDSVASEYGPLLIGMFRMALSIVTMGISGGSLNPARAFGPALVSGTWVSHWLYWIAPLMGSAGAVSIIAVTETFKLPMGTS